MLLALALRLPRAESRARALFTGGERERNPLPRTLRETWALYNLLSQQPLKRHRLREQLV